MDSFTLLLLFTTLSTLSLVGCQEKSNVYLLALAPLPDPRPNFEDPDWAAGPALIPAVRLAVKHINSRSDILKDYSLNVIENNSGCQLSSEASIAFARHILHGERQPVVGIIGPACSAAALAVANLAARIDVTQIAATAATPLLVREEFINTFRGLSSALVYVDVFLQLIEKNKWTRVAALYDSSRNYFRETYSVFEKKAKKTFLYSSHVDDIFLPLGELKSKQARVTFVFASNNLSRKLLCLAYHFDMVYPTYQWIFHNRVHGDLVKNPVNFTYNRKIYECSTGNMRIALNGAILNIYRLARSNQESADTVNGLSYKNYLGEYNEIRNTYLAELDAQRVNWGKALTETEFSNVYYDAVWSLALAINSSVSLFNISKYRYGDVNATEIIKRNLFAVDFEGMSGRISFNESSRAPVSVINVFQFEYLSSTKQSQVNLIGELYYGEFRSYANGSFILDTYMRQIITVHLAAVVIVTLVVSVVAIVLCMLQLANVLCGHHKFVRANSPSLNHLIFSGCYLFLVAALLIAIEGRIDFSISTYPTLYSVFYSTFIWCISMGYSLIFGTVCIKTYRVYYIFANFKRTGLLLSDTPLIIIVLVLLLLDLLLNAAWNLSDPWTLETTERKFNGDIIQVLPAGNCNYFVYWVVSLLIYKGILLVIVLYTSIVTRHVHKREFKYTKNINMLVYLLVLLMGVGVPVYAICSQIEHRSVTLIFMILSTILIAVPILCVVFLFLPPILPLLMCFCSDVKSTDS